MRGACPYFAIALHELTGFPLAILIDRDAPWESFGAEQIYPLIAHIFVLTPEDQALDVKGVRPVEDVVAEFHDLESPAVEQISIKALRSLMGNFRPLCRYNAKEIAEAKRLARKLIKM